MPSEKIELPPMPVHTVRVPNGAEGIGIGHTDEAMTAYALLAVKQEREQSRRTVSPGEMRYEFVRKLKPVEFAELFRRNICGEGSFDALVGEAIAAAAALNRSQQEQE